MSFFFYLFDFFVRSQECLRVFFFFVLLSWLLPFLWFPHYHLISSYFFWGERFKGVSPSFSFKCDLFGLVIMINSLIKLTPPLQQHIICFYWYKQSTSYLYLPMEKLISTCLATLISPSSLNHCWWKRAKHHYNWKPTTLSYWANH